MSVKNDKGDAITKFEDTSIDCAICLEPLAAAKVITLGCGHKWHYQCIVQQLQTAKPTSTSRLLFTGCQCAKCARICEHDDLRDLTRTTDVLRQKVDQLVQEQLALDAPAAWIQAQRDPPSLRSILDQGRRNYAFYLCSHCQEPYFGGTVDCADNLVENQDNEGERLCVACAPQPQVICRNPLEHRGYLVWKCRYCCRPSTFFCYGNVHLCHECHSARNREPIPCRGNTCHYPKPPNSLVHSNGRTSQSEQVYGCAWCQSTDRFQEPPGSCNLLHNPSGQLQLQGWKQLSPRMSWVVETSEIPVNAATTTNFVSSYMPCIMVQTLDLSTVFQTPPVNHVLEVSARYMRRTDCPSKFCLKAVLLDAQQNVIDQKSTPTLEPPPDYWERAELLFATTSNARYLSVIVMGQDAKFWRGNYGSKVTEISVRLLGVPEEIQRFLIAPTTNTNTNNTSTNQPVQVRPGGDGQIRAVVVENLLPIVSLLILAWLLKT